MFSEFIILLSHSDSDMAWFHFQVTREFLGDGCCHKKQSSQEHSHVIQQYEQNNKKVFMLPS